MQRRSKWQLEMALSVSAQAANFGFPVGAFGDGHCKGNPRASIETDTVRLQLLVMSYPTRTVTIIELFPAHMHGVGESADCLLAVVSHARC